ncbi:MAG: hypothetical protein ACRYGG_00980 [Janthinobacterium lividum]
MRIVYVPLEPYENRYTLQLREWNEMEFKRLGINYTVVEGTSYNTVEKIHTGIVLDAHTRCIWALEQSKLLVGMHQVGNLTENDFILFEDMFHPGIEALAYIFNIVEHKEILSNSFKLQRPNIAVRCLAQTIDPDDFVHYTGMAEWMRKFEQMVLKFVDVVFVASQEMIPFMTAAGWDCAVAVTGLPFGKEEVLSRTERIAWSEKELRVSFASRIADEKQFEFFLRVAVEYQKQHGRFVTFEFLSGGSLNNPAIDYAVIRGVVEVYPNLTKNEYYENLSSSRVLFNCSLQDWVSNTVSEADTYGCNTLFPAYRSFPEVFDNDRERLYIPWSVEDAVEKLHKLVYEEHPFTGNISDHQNKSIERTVHYMQNYMDSDYSEFVYPTDTSYRKRIVKEATQ